MNKLSAYRINVDEENYCGLISQLSQLQYKERLNGTEGFGPPHCKEGVSYVVVNPRAMVIKQVTFQSIEFCKKLKCSPYGAGLSFSNKIRSTTQRKKRSVYKTRPIIVTNIRNGKERKYDSVGQFVLYLERYIKRGQKVNVNKLYQVIDKINKSNGEGRTAYGFTIKYDIELIEKIAKERKVEKEKERAKKQKERLKKRILSKRRLEKAKLKKKQLEKKNRARLQRSAKKKLEEKRLEGKKLEKRLANRLPKERLVKKKLEKKQCQYCAGLLLCVCKITKTESTKYTKRIVVTDTTGTKMRFDSVRDFSAFIEISPASVYSAIHDRYGSIRGYAVRYDGTLAKVTKFKKVKSVSRKRNLYTPLFDVNNVAPLK